MDPVPHVTDSGFWLVNRYFELTEKQTFRCLIALTGFVVVLVLNLFFESFLVVVVK